MSLFPSDGEEKFLLCGSPVKTILTPITEFCGFCMRCAQVKVGLINLCKGLFSLNARIYYKLKSGT